MSRAVILEFVDAATAVALTADLAFVRLERKPEMVIGAEVELLTENQGAIETLLADDRIGSASQSKNGRLAGIAGNVLRRRSGAIASASAAVIVALSVALFAGAQSAWAKPVAYISLDVNPSIELAVSRQDRIVSVQALDVEGKVMLEHVTLQGLKIDQAVHNYLRALQLGGYLQGDTSVIVTTSAAASDGASVRAQVPALQAKVNRQVAQDLHGLTYKLASLQISSTLQKAARADHISPGRIALYAEAKKDGTKVSWSELAAGHLAIAVGGNQALQRLVDKLTTDSKLVQALGNAAAKQVNNNPEAMAQAAIALTIPIESTRVQPADVFVAPVHISNTRVPELSGEGEGSHAGAPSASGSKQSDSKSQTHQHGKQEAKHIDGSNVIPSSSDSQGQGSEKGRKSGESGSASPEKTAIGKVGEGGGQGDRGQSKELHDKGATVSIGATIASLHLSTTGHSAGAGHQQDGQGDGHDGGHSSSHDGHGDGRGSGHGHHGTSH